MEYNVGDCLVSKTSVIKILGKSSKKIYHVSKFSNEFSKRSEGYYNSYQLRKYFTRCDSTAVDKALKLINLNYSVVKSIVTNSKAKHFGKSGVSINARGYVLNRKLASYRHAQIEVFYSGFIRVSYQPWPSWGIVPIYAHEYDRLLRYLSVLHANLKELWQNTKIP